MSEKVCRCSIEQVPAGTGTTFKVGGKDIAVFNIDGAVYAMDDVCIHAGASLGAGKLEGKILTCRAHGFKYDVTTGQVRCAKALKGGGHSTPREAGRSFSCVASETTS